MCADTILGADKDSMINNKTTILFKVFNNMRNDWYNNL